MIVRRKSRVERVEDGDFDGEFFVPLGWGFLLFVRYMLS